MYIFNDKAFKTKKALFRYVKDNNLTTCAEKYFIRALAENDFNVIETIAYVKQNYKTNKISKKSFEINGMRYKNMREFEEQYDLPQGTLSVIKVKNKITVEQAVLQALELPFVKQQLAYKNSFAAKFLQLRLPTTNFVYH
ncbi:hypothetical protein [Fastidiosibacter lacustris]|uniref:hypothetical protein n=1 Tax=Fastidiosibacter lacustris TaxID=2056695 RepID=UPI000E3577FD|nr:hypothetical protein [Fastidiosibacter lacustris]